ncbi:MAG: hypothetical protein LC778_11015 [Acidobacteria bacterium]|nr:hypothetical protein [Acidobacteriota bacterium]
MHEWITEKENKLREFFALDSKTELISCETAEVFDVSSSVSEHLKRFNIEWHIVPSAEAVPIDTDDYRTRLYPTLKFDAANREYQKTNSYKTIMSGHERHQGKIIGVETTPKPRYLPGNRQFYGTFYGFDSKADPFAPYLSRAHFTSGTRYSHNYRSLREFVNLVTKEWQERNLMPEGYRLTICPPVVFNLIGNVFHKEWSATETLELGFYRDEHGNAKCFSVGSNAPDDFSYIHEIETNSDWALLGFRAALVPE